jgi:1,4-dihydroxy-2-naphthoate octaprenyltransferase
MIAHAGRIEWPHKLVGFAQLGKFQVYQHVYEWLLLFLLLDMAGHSPPASVAALYLVAMFAVQAAACAADDVMGYRDGSDAENRRENEGLPEPRKLLPKPLLTGLLAEREAIAFAAVASATAVASIFGMVAILDWDVPVAAIAGGLFVLACGLNYSSGLRLSYRPGGTEFVIFTVNAGTVFLGYYGLTGGMETIAVLIGCLVSVWFLLIVSYGNVADREGDAASDRRTLAVLLSPPSYRAVLVGLYLACVALTILPFALGLLDAVGVLCVVPVLALQTVGIYLLAVRRDARLAMRIAFRCVDVGGLGFAAAIILS